MALNIATADRAAVNKAIGAKLQKLRKQRGLSQVQLAALVGVHKNTIFEYEKGYHAVPMDKAQLIALHLGCKVSDLVVFREVR